MLIVPTLPGGYSTFCEDIRHEISGTRSLIGVYGDAINITADAPVVIPRLCIETTVWIDNENLPKSCILKVICETNNFIETEIANLDFNFDSLTLSDERPSAFSINDGATNLGQIISQLRLVNVNVAESGRIKVRLIIGDDTVALGSLLVNIAAPEFPVR